MNLPRWLVRILSALTRVYDRFFGPPRPEIVYVDDDGVGWRKPPHWLDGHYPDEGQHDWAKRDLRIHLYRFSRDLSPLPGMIDRMAIGVGEGREQVPVLWPIGQQLAEACRRLGYRRLAHAAAGDICTPEEIDRAWYANEEEVRKEAIRRATFTQGVAARWDAEKMGYAYVPTNEDATIKELTLGPLHEREGDAKAPLKPFERIAPRPPREYMKPR